MFEPRFQPNFRVTAIYGNNRIEVQDEKGNKSVRRSAHVKKIDPAEKVIQQLPPREVLEKYGRSAKLLISTKDIPDVGFPQEKLEDEVCEVAGASELTECSECSINSHEGSQRHGKHVKSGEGYEHSIRSEEHEVNPLDAECKDNPRRSDECPEHLIHLRKMDQEKGDTRRDGTYQSEGEGRKIEGNGSNVSIPGSNWFKVQIAHFVTANTGTDIITESGGTADAYKGRESNIKPQPEFSFFNGI